MHARATQRPVEALDWFARGEQFDVVLVDRLMPELDALEFANALSNTPKLAVPPIVLMSSLDSEPLRTDLFRGRLNKPVRASRLFNELVAILSEAASGLLTPIHLSPVAKAAPRAKANPLDILIAEDHPTNQRLAVLVFERLGYRADVVSNGQEVLTALERRHYDVIFMDMQMPEMDGLQATREVRKRWPGLKGPRIVAMTANAMADDRTACMDAGMDDYLAKPLRLEELVAAIGRCSARPQPAAAEVAEQRSATAAITIDEPFDPKALAALLELLGGNRWNLSSLVTLFLRDTPIVLETLQRAVAARDFKEIRRAGHTLKSTGRDFGARQLSDAGRQIESLAKLESLEPLGPLVESALAGFAVASAQITAWSRDDKQAQAAK